MKVVEITAEVFNDLAYPEPLANIYQSSCWSDYLVSKKNSPLFVKYTDENDLCMALAMFILRKDGRLTSKVTAYCPGGYLINYYDEDLLSEFEKDLTIFLGKYNVNKIIIEPRLVYENSKLANDKLMQTLNHIGYTKTRDIKQYSLPTKRYKIAKTRTGIVLKTKNINNDYSMLANMINNKDDEEYFNIHNCLKPYASLYVCYLDSVKTKRNLEEEINKCTRFINKNRDDYKYIEDIRNKLDQIEEVKDILKYISTLETSYGKDPVLTGVCMIDYSDSAEMAFLIDRDKMLNSQNVIFNTIVEDEKANAVFSIESFQPFSYALEQTLLGEYSRKL